MLRFMLFVIVLAPLSPVLDSMTFFDWVVYSIICAYFILSLFICETEVEQ